MKNLKQYARQAGVGEVRLHQTRHSYARIIAEESGSITELARFDGRHNAAKMPASH